MNRLLKTCLLNTYCVAGNGVGTGDASLKTGDVPTPKRRVLALRCWRSGNVCLFLSPRTECCLRSDSVWGAPHGDDGCRQPAPCGWGPRLSLSDGPWFSQLARVFILSGSPVRCPSSPCFLQPSPASLCTPQAQRTAVHAGACLLVRQCARCFRGRGQCGCTVLWASCGWYLAPLLIDYDCCPKVL